MCNLNNSNEFNYSTQLADESYLIAHKPHTRTTLNFGPSESIRLAHFGNALIQMV